MAIASRFQPQNLAQQRFNPFYDEMGNTPWGSRIQRRSSAVRGGQPADLLHPEARQYKLQQDILDSRPQPSYDYFGFDGQNRDDPYWGY